MTTTPPLRIRVPLAEGAPIDPCRCRQGVANEGSDGYGPSPLDPFRIAATLGTMSAVLRGIPSFFTPNPLALRGTRAQTSVEHASYYSTAPLRETLHELIDWKSLRDCRTRLTARRSRWRRSRRTP